MTAVEPTLIVWDPSGLNPAQRAGEACVVCHKRWPRPTKPAGLLPDNRLVKACAPCAEGIKR